MQKTVEISYSATKIKRPIVGVLFLCWCCSVDEGMRQSAAHGEYENAQLEKS